MPAWWRSTWGSGDEYTITGPGEVRFFAPQPTVMGGASLARRAAPEARDIRLRAVGLGQGALVVRGSGLRLLAPVASTILDRSPEFAWQDASPNLTYQFLLSDAAGNRLHATETQSATLRLPSGVQLDRGRRYRWEISAESTDGYARTAQATFRVATDALAREAAARAPDRNASFATRVPYALWLEQHDLHVDARHRWRALAAERPGDPVLRARAGE
jgi:hypothetical protein